MQLPILPPVLYATAKKMTKFILFRRRQTPNGQALIFALTLLSVLLIIATAIITLSYSSLYSVRHSYKRSQAVYLAEAGVDYAVRQLNINPSYTGTPAPMALGNGEIEISIAGGGSTRELTSTAYIPNKTDYRFKKIVRVNLATSAVNLSFNYGVQSGEGGIVMNNNARIIGNVYSNGNIVGAPGAEITGTAIVAGGIAPSPSVTWTSGNTDYTFGQAGNNIDAAQSFIAPDSTAINKISLNLKKFGSPSNSIIRIMTDNANKPSTNTIALGTLYSSLVTGSYGWVDIYMISSNNMITGNKYWVVFDALASAVNYWSVKFTAGAGYADGNMMYSQNWVNKPWTAVNGDMDFKIYSGGVDTLIQDVTVGEDAYAHIARRITVGRDFFGYYLWSATIARHAKGRELTSCTIGSDAYADINTCTTGGTKYAGAGEPDKPASGYPISDANIADFKTGASVTTITPPGGILTLDGATQSLGPAKIMGNLTLTNNTHLTLTGNLYVTGNVNISNNSIIDLDAGYGDTSGVITADGRYIISNNCEFYGTKIPGGGYVPNTHILLITTYSNLTVSGFDLSNNSVTAILFAPNSPITMSNNTNLKEATAYKLYIANNATVTYDSGLQSVLFTSGPGGSWQIQPGTYREISG